MVVSKKKNPTNEDKVGIFYFLCFFCSRHTDDHAFGERGEGSHFQYIMDVHAMYLERHTPTTHHKKKIKKFKIMYYKLTHNQNINSK